MNANINKQTTPYTPGYNDNRYPNEYVVTYFTQ